MDTLAHGLWGGAAFGQRERAQFKWAFALGMCPDLFSFGPYFLTHAGDIARRWSGHRMGPPDPRTIPPYVYHAYNVTHSLVVWSALFALAYAWVAYQQSRSLRLNPSTPLQILWPFGAWPLHILCDIPLHSTRFFPTPYLWPFPTPFYDGTPWGRRPFMIANYGLIALVYLGLLLRRKLRQSR